MTRLPDWATRLSAVIEGSRGRAFAYGEHDCCIFAADCILAVTGEDVAADWRGAYGSAEAGMKLAGARTVIELAARLLEPIPPAFARRGDIAIAHFGEDLALCVVDGPLLRGACGTFAPRAAAVRAWRVG